MAYALEICVPPRYRPAPDFQPVLQYPIGCQGCALGYNTLQQGPTVWAHLSKGWRPSPTPAGSLVIVTGNQIKIL